MTVPQFNFQNKVIDCTIFIATSDSFLPLLRPFCYLFNQFWSEQQNVTFLGYKKPDFDLPDNFNFISMGDQRGIGYWSDDLRPILENDKNDYFIYTAEDQFLTRNLNTESLRRLLNIARDKNPAKISLASAVATQAHENYSDEKEPQIITSSQNADYRLSLTWSMWRKDYFLKYLHPNFSQWDFELKNMKASKGDGELIIACKKDFPLGHCNAVQTFAQPQGFDFNSIKLNFCDVTIPAAHHLGEGVRLEEKYINELLNLQYIKENNIK